MNFFSRAYRNVSRKLTKTILLAVTFFMIGNLVILGLGVSQAAENAKILTRQKMKAIVNFEVDYNEFYKYTESITDEDEREKAYKNYPKLDAELASQLASDDRVKAYNYMVNSPVLGKNIEHVPVGNEEFQDNSGGSSYFDENGNEIKYIQPNLQIYTNITPTMIEFEDGTNTIVEGRFYNQSEIDNSAHVVVITKELADHNNLKIGDTIITGSSNSSYISTMSNGEITDEQLQISYEIVGIYTTIKEVDPSAQNFKWMMPYESPKNIMYVPMTTYAEDSYNHAKLIYDYRVKSGLDVGYDEYTPTLEEHMLPYKVVYLLDDPLNVDSFVKDNEGKLPEYTILNANNETFKELAKPLDTLSFFANVIVWIVGINAVVIITLVTALTLKTREFEIGVLMSLGVSKLKIVLQLFAELLLVAVIGFTAAIASGSLIAGKVGDEVLKFQQSQQDAKEEDPWEYEWKDPTDYFSTVSQDELFEQYKVSVSPFLIAEIYIFGLGVVFIAILVPSAMIMRLNPKQILLSTN